MRQELSLFESPAVEFSAVGRGPSARARFPDRPPTLLSPVVGTAEKSARRCRRFRGGWCSWGILILLIFGGETVLGQENLFSRNFNLYQGVVPGVDFLAGEREEIVPFEKPVAAARKVLETFLQRELPKGAVFVCSSTEQRDSIYEPKAFRMGYRWVVPSLTPEVGVQQAVDRLRARTGGQIPAERMERLKQRASGIGSRLVGRTVQEMGFAILMTTLAPEKEFRASRIEDMNRSPLVDWLDIGLATHAAGLTESQLHYLQRRLDAVYPIEDILFMSRPVVVPTFVEGGPEISGGIGRPPAPGEAGARSGSPPGESMSVPEDVLDRMTYDAQSAALFEYLVERLGVARVQEIIRGNLEGQECQAILEREEFLGPDLRKAEDDWLEWVKNRPGRSTDSEPPQGAPLQPEKRERKGTGV